MAIQFEQLDDLVKKGTNTTSTFHQLSDGTLAFFVFLGLQGGLIRYEVKSQESELVDDSLPFEAFGRKFVKPQPNENIIYATPGNDSNGDYSINQNEIIRIDPTVPSYESVDSIDTGLDDPQAAGIGGDAYFWGGGQVGTTDSPPNPEVYRIDGETGSTTEVGTLSPSIANAPFDTLEDGTVLTFGGISSDGDEPDKDGTSAVYKVDPTVPSQEKIGDMNDGSGNPVYAYRAFGGILEDDMYIFGGSVGTDNNFEDTYHSEVWRVDLDTFEVSTFAQMQQDVIDTIPGYDNLNNNLYSFGGTNPGPDEVADVYRIVGPNTTDALLLEENLALRGRDVSAGDDAVLYSPQFARGESIPSIGDDIAVVRDGDGQA
ncbi:hypothetical protein HHTV1_37 [Haloarcula hispanica tailed virus 1]|uniref:Uncharacterized protein n=1 Tax=Haloarcula hispanica tailed virus 1 TaxID=1273750 RepID=R4TKU1_9CAUD|nr:hypothetical protein M198_gp37 [Haloarcula hispanica tailed virus 1]AGM11292.1 hypothetical protein HHTV1_37 [Haloarcula hispanica tailed virus 1]